MDFDISGLRFQGVFNHFVPYAYLKAPHHGAEKQGEKDGCDCYDGSAFVAPDVAPC
jgi:hypothetical protein